jgi:pyochelin synthetase
MPATKLLTELSNQGIQLWVSGAQLQYRAPKGKITPAIRTALIEHKSQLITLLQQKQSVLNKPSTIQVHPNQRHEPFPLSNMQQAYWLGQSNLFELGNIAAHLYAEFELENLDCDRLNQVCQSMIERHEMLRVVILSDGQQQILPIIPPFSVEVVDLTGQPPQMISTCLETTRQRMVDQGPTTDQFPLFEVLIHRLGDEGYRVHLNLSLLIFDGGSLKLLAQEIPLLYNNPGLSLPPLELSFRDYILALKSLQDSESYQKSQSYWWKRLDTLPPAPELPLAQSPATLSYPKFRRRTFKLTPDLWQHLKHQASQRSLTPAGVVCAAYTEILAAWSKTDRFTLNVLFSNRLELHPQVRKVIGNFSSTNLLEVDHVGVQTFAARAKKLQEQLWRDFEHSQIGGVEVLRELNRVRGGTSRASIPVVFASSLDARDQSSTEAIGSFPTPLYSCIQTPQVWLDHSIHESFGALVLHWDAIEALFPLGMLDEMFSAYKKLLHQLATDDEIWNNSALSLLPAVQQHQRVSINATDAPISSALLHTLATKSIQKFANQPAIIASKKILTYTDLDRIANRVGSWLQHQGARPNVLVAIVMEKGWEQVAATLGILRSGAAYLPINPTLPKERLWYLLQQSEVGLVLTQSRWEQTLDWLPGLKRLCIDDEAALADWDDTPLSTVQTPEDLAYVIFTSGSTGLPKGVMIDHRGAVNTICDLNKRFKVTVSDRVLALSSLSFDLSVYDIFGTLAAGGTIIMPDATITPDPAYWTELLVREQVTIWNSVPALMQMLTEYLNSQPNHFEIALRLVMLSGDWVPLTLPAQIRSLVPNASIISLGGATEASIWSILYPIQTVEPHWKSIPYGFPMVNQSFQVFNAAFKPCPVWVPGELYIGGIGLAKGYWHDTEKTQARFITHPYTGERLYRTGDLGRYLPDGNIEFLGREDFQVKVQGYRIELGEIETALEQHPQVKSVVVNAVGDRQSNKSLVAYLVTQETELESHTLFQELQHFLKQRLPDYMVPSRFMALAALPLTANGKIDRKALPTPSRRQPRQSTALVTPCTPLELHLTQIWQDLFETDKVSITDNFFDLGGNSLIAVRLVARIQKQLGQALSLSTLLQEPTIKHLAKVLNQQTVPLSQSPLVRIQEGITKRPFFCVHPVGGNVLCYSHLARSLGADQPFYGLQSIGEDSTGKLLMTIEAMASAYISAIRTVQPHGPYLISGWSMGGVIAFEMVQQLQRQGESINLLALIDSRIPSTDAIEDNASLLLWFVKDLGGWSGKKLTIKADDLAQFDPEQQLKLTLEQAKQTNIVASDIELAQFSRLFQTFKNNAQALNRYRPQSRVNQEICNHSILNQIVLFYPTETSTESTKDESKQNIEDLGWETVTKVPIKVHQVPGNHYTMLMPPNLQLLTEHIHPYLSKVE